MGILNREKIQAASQGFKALFFETLAKMTPMWSKVAMQIDSDSLQETYDWLDGVPELREFIDERAIRGLRAFSYTIAKKKWESTLEVDVDDIKYDRLGLVKPRIQALAEAIGRHYDKLIFGLLNDGFTNACYDSKAFFATDHPKKGGSWSNKDTAALSATSYADARKAMMSFTDYEGNFLAVMPNLLVVPPALEATAREILLAERDEDGKSNVWRNTADFIVSPYLASETAWFLLDTSKVYKPLVLQIHGGAPEWIAKDDPETSDEVFKRDKCLYGVKAEHNAGYLFPQLAYGSTGAS